MKKLIQKKTIATQHSVHVHDQAVLIDFLNENSKAIGTIENLGSFIDISSVRIDIGIKVTNNYLVVERNECQKEVAGKELKLDGGTKKNIFEYPYELPDDLPKKPTKKEVSIILATVKTHSCNPYETCNKCKGTGKCTACDARGFNRCDGCEGSGKIEERDGNYANGKAKYRKVACPTCHGSKRISCLRCNGSSECEKCNGSGKVTCERCNGTAFYQTYDCYSTSYKTVLVEKSYTEIQEVEHVISETKNQVVFNDDLMEWKFFNAVLRDKQSNAIKQNPYFSKLMVSFNADAGLAENQKIGRIHTAIENVPITAIDYSFEDNNYTVYIVGENNIVCYENIPKKHIYRAGLLARFINFFTKKKRQQAFLYIAAYMFYSDGSMSEQEKQLLELLLNHVNLSQVKQLQFKDKLGRKLSFDEIAPYLGCIKNDPRAVVFAWQCVLQDKNIEESEIAAFNVLANFFKVDTANYEKLKLKAEKFGRLKDTQLLREYFK